MIMKSMFTLDVMDGVIAEAAAGRVESLCSAQHFWSLDAIVMVLDSEI